MAKTVWHKRIWISYLFFAIVTLCPPSWRFYTYTHRSLTQCDQDELTKQKTEKKEKNENK